MSTLCVMGGRLWFLSHACSSYTCTGSALDVMDYGLAKAKSSVNNKPLGRHLYYVYLQVISPTAEQHTFCSVLYGEDPVFDLSLHVLQAPRSVLWVVGYGFLVMPVLPTRARALRSTLWTIG